MERKDDGLVEAPLEEGSLMRWKLLNADPPVTYAVALQTDEEVMPALEKFIRDHEIEAASVTAIGAFSQAVLGYFDWNSKEYRKNPVAEQVEVVSLLGDVAVAESGPVLHVHAVLGKADGSAVGGHLLQARVRPTLEVILTQSPSYMRKRYDPKTGLKLLALDPT
jgi:predicted DNA-binding protein with PD1-like motif